MPTGEPRRIANNYGNKYQSVVVAARNMVDFDTYATSYGVGMLDHNHIFLEHLSNIALHLRTMVGAHQKYQLDTLTFETAHKNDLENSPPEHYPTNDEIEAMDELRRESLRLALAARHRAAAMRQQQMDMKLEREYQERYQREKRNRDEEEAERRRSPVVMDPDDLAELTSKVLGRRV